jgi:4-cresol dehydrogenase (hydroxylating)
MHDNVLGHAVAEWQSLLGPEHAATDPERLGRLQQSVSGWSREIGAVLEPVSTPQVIGVVEIANRYRVPLYPVSQGRNWGLGSFVPVRDGCAIVDLGRMNRIVEVNGQYGYAVLEPGVTQQQLFEHLRERHPTLFFNVTGSSRDTSVVGNWLERGIGYFRSRAEEGSGLEVVLGNGQLLHTGFGHLPGAAATHLYRFGVGPSLDQLFAQGNFGIVTRMGISLLHCAPSGAAVICTVPDTAGLERLIDILVELRRSEQIRWVAHVGNRARAESSLGPLAREYLIGRGVAESELAESIRRFIRQESYSGWSAICGISGARPVVRRTIQAFRRRLRGTGRVRVLDAARIDVLERLTGLFSFWEPMRRKRALLPALREMYGLAQGKPTNETMKGVFWGVGESPPGEDWNPDHHQRCGWLYCLPMIPLCGRDARQAAELAAAVLGRFGLGPFITFNVVDHRILEGVINVAFDRSQADQVDRAHEAVRALQAEYAALGWYPYRLGVHEMERFVRDEDPYWQVIRDLKQVFDPNHIIAPGRYNLV